MKLHIKKTFNNVIDEFDPTSFIYVTGTAMASSLLHTFPFPAYWLRVCSYIMFALGVLIFFYFHIIGTLQLLKYIRTRNIKGFFNKQFMNFDTNVFWGIYIIAFTGLINYLIQLSENELLHLKSGKGMIIFIYVLWWLDLSAALFVTWGITFINWRIACNPSGLGKHANCKQKILSDNFKSSLFLSVIPIVVVAASGGLLAGSKLFLETVNRNNQLLIIVITLLLWTHVFTFVIVVLALFYLNLYINKLPPANAVFSLFIVLGPLGMGGFGILLITKNIQTYVNIHYPLSAQSQVTLTLEDVTKIAVPWAFRIVGLVFSLLELTTGFFFTIISVLSVLSYIRISNKANRSTIVPLYQYHKGWWTLAFPCGSMALGVKEIYEQYNPYTPIDAIRIISVIYYGSSIVWCIVCLLGSLRYQILPFVFQIFGYDGTNLSLIKHKSKIQLYKSSLEKAGSD
ncbi:hypothetical protein TPHA_0I01770 [Tetrapisispora phaffii CBS 4417]|uniref:Sulfite efflux pump SSU1 n=1 Tax=Tetrapisispora phaffii (strain ATCC 24235 / CBS 4417 / NBRC 1672 / NRRL Y-8282 / UCD 70-5) TaxID=1071381 RepID=G8BXQ3_TETPH|nr:hypothetical protein TPHA_0I01770 [Tetrapisispora phaffii CBS 4417]CCE64681.1 hypothetical protein TPHA_0I01770 [Tetrapisispora phaffii CBS 4417]